MGIFTIMLMTTRDKTIDGLNNKLEAVPCLLLQWFAENNMQANASKFQYIVFKSDDKLPDRNVLHIQDGVDLKSESCV